MVLRFSLGSGVKEKETSYTSLSRIFSVYSSHSRESILFFLLLQDLQEGTRLSFVLSPPRESGTP